MDTAPAKQVLLLLVWLVLLLQRSRLKRELSACLLVGRCCECQRQQKEKPGAVAGLVWIAPWEKVSSHCKKPTLRNPLRFSPPLYKGRGEFRRRASPKTEKTENFGGSLLP